MHPRIRHMRFDRYDSLQRGRRVHAHRSLESLRTFVLFHVRSRSRSSRDQSRLRVRPGRIQRGVRRLVRVWSIAERRVLLPDFRDDPTDSSSRRRRSLVILGMTSRSHRQSRWNNPSSMKRPQDDAGCPRRSRRRSTCRLQGGAAQHLRREEEAVPRVLSSRHAHLGDRAAALQ